MGYGGALIWTGLARNLKKRNPEKKVVLIYKKRLVDYILKRKIPDFVIYKNNKDIDLLVSRKKWFFTRKKNEATVVDMSDSRTHYWKNVTDDRIILKRGKHAIEIACEAFGIKNAEIKPRIVLDTAERMNADGVLIGENLADKQYICVEPNSKATFNPNKGWIWEHWQELVDKIKNFFEENNQKVKIVQIGAKGAAVLNNVVDLTGRTSFREVARVLEKSMCFIGCEGGLVHLTNAVGVRSVVLMSTWMPKELFAYPNDEVLYSEKHIHDCGSRKDCSTCRASMEAITVNMAFEAFLKIFKGN